MSRNSCTDFLGFAHQLL